MVLDVMFFWYLNFIVSLFTQKGNNYKIDVNERTLLFTL